MRLNTTRRTLAVACAVFVSVLAGSAMPSRAQQGAGTYAGAFLKIPVGARLTSSPDAVAGLRPEASLMYSNPSFVSSLSRAQAFATTTEWLDNLVFSAVGTAIPLGDGSTVLGIGTAFLYSGSIDGYDSGMNVVTQENFYDVGIDVVVSRAFRGTGLSVAAGATYVREHVLPQDGSGYAFHVGASYWLGRNLFHLAGRDLGGAVTFDSGSWEIASEWVGGAARVLDSPVGQFYAGAQIASSDAYGTRLQFGVDYAVNSLITLRSGISDNVEGGQSGKPLNAGFGLNYGPMTFEYAYTTHEFFASTHTLSLGYTFGTHGSRYVPPTVPAGDFAPPVAESDPIAPQAAPAVRSTATREPVYVLVAGSHAWLESARAEARALELLKVPAKVETNGTRYRVVVGRFTTAHAAETLQREYAASGHVLHVVAE